MSGQIYQIPIPFPGQQGAFSGYFCLLCSMSFGGKDLSRPIGVAMLPGQEEEFPFAL